MSRDLQELEQVDFQAQQEAKPWKVPDRTRQSIVDDVAAWWNFWPHARKGRECLQRTGLTNQLPPMECAGHFTADGTYVPARFALAAPEDDRITREARRVWMDNRMPEVRAAALSEVQEDWDRKRLTAAADIWKYLEDVSEPENEMYEGVDVEVGSDSDSAPSEPPDDDAFDQCGEAGAGTSPGGVMPEKQDADSSKGAPAAERAVATAEVKPSAAGARALVAVEVKPPADGDLVCVQLADALADYDRMFEIARSLKDARAMHLIAQCKDTSRSLHRHLDPAVRAELDKAQAEATQQRDALRKRLREEERVAFEAAKKRKLAEAEKKAAAEERKLEREKLDQLRLQIDTKWHEKDFGQGLPEGPKGQEPDFRKVAKVEIVNYREALQRLRIRAPELPDHLAAQWADLLQEFPVIWLDEHRHPYGNNAGRKFIKSVQDLLEAGLPYAAAECITELHVEPRTVEPQSWKIVEPQNCRPAHAP